MNNLRKKPLFILHADGDDEVAEKIAAPLKLNYEIDARAYLKAGESYIRQANSAVGRGVPIVLCGTLRTAGSAQVKQSLFSFEAYSKGLLFPVRVDKDADLSFLGGDIKIADCSENFEKGIKVLSESIAKRYRSDGKILRDEDRAKKLPFLDQPVYGAIIDTNALDAYRRTIREEIQLLYSDQLADEMFLTTCNVMEDGNLTRTGVLLFGIDPLMATKSAFCQCSVYTTESKTSARAILPVLGPLQTQVERAFEFVKQNISKSEKLLPGELRTVEEFDYPMITIREMLVNAFVHRDYEDETQKIHVRIYPNRVEITNPGRWEGKAIGWPEDGAVPIDKLISESMSKNARLAMLISWIKLYEGEGSGLPKSREECLRLGVRIPEVEARDEHVTVRVFPMSRRKAMPVGAGAVEGKVESSAARQPRNLPFASLGDLFIGRDKVLDDLRAALLSGKGAAVTSRALHGLGGIGKTRLAIEYALRYAADYSALLFLRADNAATLNASLAALAGAEVLDLPEKEAREDAAKIEAALGWLADHPTWLMILDNVEDDEAVRAVDSMMARLNGGHVIVTARAANFPEGIRTLELDALDEGAGSLFLLERTFGYRQTSKDDEAQARALARELGGLALGLEQAGAQIAKQRISFARYMKLLSENRAKALAWSDPNITRSEKTLATTWVTSVAQLSAESRRLLDRLAFLAPDPIPDSLLDVAVPGEAADYDAYEARAGLYAYSLATQAKGEDGAAKGFVVHRLVQDFARRAMTDERRREALREALAWVDAAFVGDPSDVRSWPGLDPLAPHAIAVARRADEVAIAEPTGRLFNQLALLSNVKARYAEAEPLYRRALAISEASLGPDHPSVAIRLNNLALLLLDTNRLGEAEPLVRRALEIGEKTLGPDHPNVATRLNNLAGLLSKTNRLAEAETLHRRALAIREKSYGPDYPAVAISLNNLAGLLSKTNRLAEAEPLYRRALSISEKSYGPDHPEVAIRLNNLAGLLGSTNRLGEAEPHLRRALGILEKSYGPDHPSTVTVRENLAALLADLGKGA